MGAIKAFLAEPLPDHFTDYTHCCECAEHDELLRARDRETLALEDVGNAGWDPICFVTAEVERAAILLRYAAGEGPAAIQHALGLSRPTIYKCIDKALAAR